MSPLRPGICHERPLGLSERKVNWESCKDAAYRVEEILLGDVDDHLLRRPALPVRKPPQQERVDVRAKIHLRPPLLAVVHVASALARPFDVDRPALTGRSERAVKLLTRPGVEGGPVRDEAGQHCWLRCCQEGCELLQRRSGEGREGVHGRQQPRERDRTGRSSSHEHRATLRRATSFHQRRSSRAKGAQYAPRSKHCCRPYRCRRVEAEQGGIDVVLSAASLSARASVLPAPNTDPRHHRTVVPRAHVVHPHTPRHASATPQHAVQPRWHPARPRGRPPGVRRSAHPRGRDARSTVRSRPPPLWLRLPSTDLQ